MDVANAREVFLAFIIIVAILAGDIYDCDIYRRWRTRPFLSPDNRRRFGIFTSLFNYFKHEDEELFYKFIRMSVNSYEKLYAKLEDKLRKQDTIMRESIDPEIKLAAVLSYLAHGNQAVFTSWLFRIGVSTFYESIEEVCTAIVEVLAPEYLAFPDEDDWSSISKNLWKRWNMPNCLGPVDGKHIRIQCPPHSGSLYFNYKKYFSMVLMATCDALGRFTWANFGFPGSLNDAAIFEISDLGKMLNENSMRLPPAKCLPKTRTPMPYFFIGDSGFPLKKYMMTPYARGRRTLSTPEKIYNYRLSRCRRQIESAFGMLAKRWRILQTSMNFSPEKTKKVVMALLCLHNYVLTENSDLDLDDVVDEEPNFVLDNVQRAELRNNRINEGLELRENLKKYFLTRHGSVRWQRFRI